ncbi:chymotrypsinogen B-like isoform X1 [Sitophilus oryzae]|uniref:Chymotrypsinogen B-like isoform X1 n=1 Tax=Sitophilus oryzae TaxID=7048 RepID=A0A6J2Y7M7_SITOR|nr:chymotrypsinogen B-like isoform X1 [Sitophilus oryzae]
MLRITQFVVLALAICHFGQVLAMEGGEPAAEGEFPYMVSIRDSLNKHICGGTIIGDIWILTSNICHPRSWYGYVRYGSNLLDDDGQLPVNTSLNIAKVNESIYNKWATDIPPYTHDLNLLRLEEPIQFSETVQPVQLPVLDEEWPYNQTATILGWGQPHYWRSQVHLQKANVPLFTDQYCHDFEYENWKIPDVFVMKCGGAVNESYHCFNDYGGPVIYNGIQYGQREYGIQSYVYARADADYLCGAFPSIYSPVSYFREWIKNTTGI